MKSFILGLTLCLAALVNVGCAQKAKPGCEDAHPCICGCEETGKCVCKNCNEGTGIKPACCR